ncbi:protein telomere ends associated isoform X2 [Drosophila rhopaloa]|uniref:Protein telomere ends associated n=1 Tax=Drosophila rhopaloa TaxID=1041015 RepID=A0ABM5I0I2_DRORH|nr:protein telomere ends associated isoform X2 [Drosophila rhopaloa]
MTYPVTFKAFKKLIVNLQDIARELQAQDESNKTEEEWTYWYYQAFFRDPSVRKRYAFKVAPCPRHVLHKLLKDPDTETEDMAVDDEAEAATHTLPEESHGVIVEVERKGKFVFPVSFKTFLNSLNQKKVFFKITKTKEDFEKLLVDEALAHLTLKKLYNRFYMFPEKRCQINFFNDKPATSLAKLLQFGRPHNETAAKTLEKHAAKVANDKNYTDNTKDLHKRIDNDAISEEQSLSQPGPTTSSQVRELPRAETPECDSKESEGQKSGFKYPVSFKLFKSHVCNLTEIVKKMKLCDEHEMKTEEMCLRDYYKGFYSAPEMREKFICRFKPCPAKMHIKLLSFPQKHNEKNPKDLDFPILKGTTEKPPHSCKEAVDEQSQSLSQSTMSSSGRVLPKAKTSECATEGIKETVPGTEPDCHGDYIPEKLGVKYPVSFKLFKSHVCNITEIVKQMKLCDEHKMKTEEMCLRDYYKGFYSVPEMRKKFVCRFKPCPAKMHMKLLSFPQKHKEKKSSDIDFTIVNGTNEKPPHSCKEAVDEQSQSLPQSTMSSSGRVLPKAKTSESATKSIKETVPRTKPDCQGNCIREKLGVQYPVSFKLFKSHVCNITEIVKKMKLCDEHKMKTEEMCLRDYYKGFYSVPEMRKKFVCRFKPCPAKMQQKLLSFPPKHKEKNSKDLDFPIVKGTTEKPPHSCKEAVDEQSQSLPQSTMYSSGRVLPKAKTSECATKSIKETVPRTEPDCQGNYIRKKLVVQYPVSFKLFKSQVCNLTEIVKQMKLCDEHKMKSEEMCLRDYYKGFYSVPEMRKKFVCRFKPCPAKMHIKLLSFPQKHNEKNPKDLDFPILKGTTEKPPHSCKEAVDEQSQSLPQSTIYSSGRVLPKAKTSECATEGIKETVPGTEPDCHGDCIPEKLGVKYPVSFKLFKSRVCNLMEIVKQMKLCDEHKMKTEEMCLRDYYKGFYSAPEMREKFICHFKPCPAKMQQKLLSFPPKHKEKNSKDLDFPIVNGTTEKPPHSCKEAVDEQSQSLPQSTMSSSGRVLPKAKTSECATEGIEETVPGTEPDSHRDCIPEKLGVKYPVSFELFKRHVSNLKEIVHNMKLCDEYKGETEEMCIKNYYKGFYATPEMREKFVCRFKPCPARMQKKLVSFPPKPTDCPNENASTEKPVDESRQVPFSIPRGNTNTTTESQVTHPNEEVAAIAKLTNKDYELTEHTIFNVLYRFPVSFLSFLHAINYDVIIEKLVSHTYRKKGLQKQKDILGNKTTCVKILYRYYRSFYYDNKIRKRFKYNFNAAPIELRSQFLELAEPISQPQNQSEAEPQLNIQHPSLSNNSTQSMGDLFAARLLELNGKQIIDVVDYTWAESLLPEENACSVATSRVVNSESPAATPVKEIESNSSTVTEGSRENRVTSLLNTSSAQKSEKQILLEQAKEIFFAENTPDHKLKYLICTSNGHMRSLWRILYQLTLQEFSDYTSIHNGEGLYESSEDLQLCYEHVVNLGNWPINLGVKLPFLKQLHHIKGVQLDKLDLGRLSPKIVNSWELGIYSNFDIIVEQMYTQHSRKIIDDVVQLFQQRDQLYAACWTHNEWIPQVPEITDESLNAAIEVEERVLDEISLRSLCGVESRDGGSPAEIVSIASTIDIVQEEPSCPPTQFNITNFVDMENLSLFSQATQIAADPLMSQEITDVVEASQVPETPTDSTSTPMEIVSVKNEPTFLNKQRGTINSNGCDWETIASEEQIIDLDETQNEGSSFSCFAISKPADEKEEELKAPAPLELPSGPSTSAHQGTVNLGKRLAANNGVPSKRIKLINDNVPQLRHQFPALPMAVMVRIESGANQPPDPVDKTTPQPEESDITPSQDFAAGNTLLESSNLNALLDATNVNTRKVIEEQVDTVSVRVPASKPDAVPRLHSNVVFRKLERFYYVESLTLEHIIKCRIERYVEGASYQDALVKIDDGLCNLRGPLLKTLFFQESPTLQSDVQQVLRDLGEFTYKRRWPVHKDATVDLRTRVLHVFMDVAPKFGFFRIQFDNATKEWATCSEMGRWNTETEEREISCDVTAFISPDILERMKELKDLMA